MHLLFNGFLMGFCLGEAAPAQLGDNVETLPFEATQIAAHMQPGDDKEVLQEEGKEQGEQTKVAMQAGIPAPPLPMDSQKQSHQIETSPKQQAGKEDPAQNQKHAAKQTSEGVPEPSAEAQKAMNQVLHLAHHILDVVVHKDGI